MIVACGVDHALAFLDSRGHGFLANHMQSTLGRGDGHRFVLGVWHREKHPIDQICVNGLNRCKAV